MATTGGFSKSQSGMVANNAGLETPRSENSVNEVNEAFWREGNGGGRGSPGNDEEVKRAVVDSGGWRIQRQGSGGYALFSHCSAYMRGKRTCCGDIS